MEFYWLESLTTKREHCVRKLNLKDIQIATRGGLRQDLQLAYNYLPYSRMGRVLDVLSPGGGLTAFLRMLGKECNYLHFLLSEIELAESNCATNMVRTDGLCLVTDCTSIKGLYDSIVHFAVMDSRTSFEFIEQCYDLLNQGGLLYLITPKNGSEQRLQQVVQNVFGQKAEFIADNNLYAMLRNCKKSTLPHNSPRLWQQSFECNLRGQDFVFTTRPGVFSESRMDKGSSALIETMRIEEDDKICDLGCGYGPIGLTAARLAPAGMVYMVDTNLRAVEMSRLNAEQNYIYNVEIGVSDGFSALNERGFNVILSNPPYHTDYRVAKGFVEEAKRRMCVGGRLYLVVKKADWYAQKLRSVFGNVRIIEKDGYLVLESISK